jgi:hypothetical protein
MTYNALQSIDFTNFVNVLMCFPVNCSNGGGPGVTGLDCGITQVASLIFQLREFKIMWLIVCSHSLNWHLFTDRVGQPIFSGPVVLGLHHP